LAGGAGTYIFLVGVGYFEGDQFCVRQYFMRDYNEERALLSAVNELLSNFEAIVSYNGKTFDVPLIQSRFIMSGMKLSLKTPVILIYFILPAVCGKEDWRIVHYLQ